MQSYGVDMSKVPKKQSDVVLNSATGTTGTFRKLNVD